MSCSEADETLTQVTTYTSGAMFSKQVRCYSSRMGLHLVAIQLLVVLVGGWAAVL